MSPIDNFIKDEIKPLFVRINVRTRFNEEIKQTLEGMIHLKF